jgi:hypothetical protein
MERMLADKPHPEMGYRACLGIMRLAKTYSHERMEGASERCSRARAVTEVSSPSSTTRSTASRLRLRLCGHCRRMTTSAGPSTSNRRSQMLEQPMMEKLAAMRCTAW